MFGAQRSNLMRILVSVTDSTQERICQGTRMPEDALRRLLVDELGTGYWRRETE